MSDMTERLSCSSCGAPLDLKPGLRKTACPYCGTVHLIRIPEEHKTDKPAKNSYDIPEDIEIVPMDYREMSLANTLSGPDGIRFRYSLYSSEKTHYMPGEWRLEGGNRYEPVTFTEIGRDSDRFRILDDELQIRYALSYLLDENYDLGLRFDFSEDSVVLTRLYDPNSIKKGTLFTRVETLREREKLRAENEASKMLDGKVREIAKWLDFDEPVQTGSGDVYHNWTVSRRVTPGFAEAHLHKDFLETIKRVSDNPVLDRIAEEMARYLNMADGQYIRVGEREAQIGEWEEHNDGDIGWYTCKYNPDRGIVWKSAGGGSIEYVGDRLEWKYKAFSMDSIKDPHTRMAVLAALIPKIFRLTADNGDPRYVVRDVFMRTVRLGRTKKYVKKYNQW